MKENKRSKHKKKQFRRDPNKQYIKKFRIYPSFLYSRLDKWLKKMSLSGWHVVHCGFLFFWFEKGEPMNKEYFTYDYLSAYEGAYSIDLRFPFWEKTYGVKRKKSIINSNQAKKRNIIEIDTKKIDIKKDAGYLELISDRNRLSLRFFIRNLAVIAIVILILLLLILLL